MKSMLFGTAAVVTMLGSAAQAQLADGSFETQAGSVSNFCYFNAASPGGPACPTGAWTGSGTGFQIETNLAWPGAPTPDGTHYAFVQGTGTLSQTFVADASGLFAISWLAAGRPPGVEFGDETYTLTVNGQSLGTFSTTTGQPFTQMISDPFAFILGTSYTLSFNGLPSSADNTAFIDAVQLTPAVPEPRTWAMMLLGFGVVGALIRRRSKRPGTQAIPSPVG